MWFSDIDIETDHGQRHKTGNGTSQTRHEIMRAQRIAMLKERAARTEIADEVASDTKAVGIREILFAVIKKRWIHRSVG